MKREEAKNIAIKCLLENNSNRDFYANSFEKFLNQGYNPENIPIPPLYIDNIRENNNLVFIEENVYNELLKIRKITERTNNEIPYFIIGFEQKNGSVVFKNIIADIEQNSIQETDYDRITTYFAEYLRQLNNTDIEKNGKLIICKGHTHGIGSVSDNFSFGDLISYVSFKFQIRDFIKTYNHKGVNPNDIDTVGMLMNPCSDFNIVYYDDNPYQMGFYKFTNIFLKTKDNKAILLPSLSENGNYIKKDIENRKLQ